MSLINRLRAFDIFADFSDNELRQFATFVEEATFSDGQVIVDDAHGGNSLYFLLAGKVQLVRKFNKANLNTTLAGNVVFGEVAFADQGPRSATICAEGDAEIGIFAYDHFEVIKKQSPALGMKFLLQIMKTLAGKFRVVNKTLDGIARKCLGDVA